MSLEVGFGRYAIMPPLGVPLAGYAQREGVAEGVHDELTARAVAFAGDGEAALLVMADVCSVPPEVCRGTAEIVEERTGVPSDNVIVASVHTHSGPALHEESPYRMLLPELLASAGQTAWKARQPATLSFTEGKAPGLCINRRAHNGPVDDKFCALLARTAEGGGLGVLFSYPLHGVVMGHTNLQISADYLGVARRTVEAAMGVPTAVFCASASGDMNPLTPTVDRLAREAGEGYWTDDPVTGIYDRSNGTFEEVELLGRSLGDAVVAAIAVSEPIPSTPFRVQRWTVDLGDEKEVPAELAAIEVGSLCLLALPGEHLIDTGAKLRQAAESANRDLIVVTHAGHLCYVPPAREYEHGGYEIESAVRRGLARDAQSRLCDSVCQQVFADGD